MPFIGMTCSAKMSLILVGLFSNEEIDDEEKPFQRRTDYRPLKEHQAGMSAAELCRKHGVSDAAFYKWRSSMAAANCLRPSG